MSILHDILKVKSVISEVEALYERLSPAGEPSAAQIAMPLIYRHMLERNSQLNIADERLLALAGHYLATQFPEVREYFISDEQRKSIALFRQTLDDIFIEHEEQAAIAAPEARG